MIVGIGTDIVDVRRIQRSLTRFGERFTDKGSVCKRASITHW